MKVSSNTSPKLKFIVTVKSMAGRIKTEYEGAFSHYVIFDEHLKKLRIKDFNEEYLQIESDGGIVEKNSDGSINLLAKAPYEFTVYKGETIKLGLQMTDIGCTIEITYEGIV